ncbi:hypothetical protein HELRODRAFT_189220 [Helobdella robusta]|uniref:RING-type E3 ubiquitin transferase n=1 Tax=Helobdella robusta TaxID=6412 RepID=T1FQT4_HELRO|nr:hypothetical protein HELRODRAFT_189220 [Helobdella robusta]ESN96377.1 hypothetical protein HELRODRAFT_189220 [Helobdella robusta]
MNRSEGITSRSSIIDQCSICYYDIAEETKSATSLCFHEFCLSCIKRLAKLNAVCPICRLTFTEILNNIGANVGYDAYGIPRPTLTAKRRLDRSDNSEAYSPATLNDLCNNAQTGAFDFISNPSVIYQPSSVLTPSNPRAQNCDTYDTVRLTFTAKRRLRSNRSEHGETSVNSNGLPVNNSTYNNPTFNNSTYNYSTYNNSAFNDSTYNNQTFNNSTYNNSVFNNTTYNNPAFNDSTNNNQTFNNSTYNNPTFNDSAYNISTFDNSTSNNPTFNNSTSNNQTFNNSTYNNPTFNNSTYNNQTINNSTYNNQTLNNSTYNNSTYNNQTLNNSTYNNQTFNNSTYNDQTFNNLTGNNPTHNNPTCDFEENIHNHNNIWPAGINSGNNKTNYMNNINTQTFNNNNNWSMETSTNFNGNEINVQWPRQSSASMATTNFSNNNNFGINEQNFTSYSGNTNSIQHLYRPNNKRTFSAEADGADRNNKMMKTEKWTQNSRLPYIEYFSEFNDSYNRKD